MAPSAQWKGLLDGSAGWRRRAPRSDRARDLPGLEVRQVPPPEITCTRPDSEPGRQFGSGLRNGRSDQDREAMERRSTDRVPLFSMLSRILDWIEMSRPSAFFLRAPTVQFSLPPSAVKGS